MAPAIHVNAKLAARQRKGLHEQKGLTLGQLPEKYRVAAAICKWKKWTDFDGRTHAPKNPRPVLCSFEEPLPCEVSKSTGFSTNLVHGLKAHAAHIGMGNVQGLLAREKLNRKEYLITEGEKAKPKRFKTYSAECLHIGIKRLPKGDKMRRYLFVAIDRNTRLVTIGIYPQSGIKEPGALLRHCASFFEFPLSHVRTGNAERFTDRSHRGLRRIFGKHLLDKTRKQLAVERRLTPAFHPQTATVAQRLNPRVSQLLKSVHFESQQALTETMPWAHQSLQSQPDATGPWGSDALRLLEPGKGQKGKTESKGPPQSRTRRSRRYPCEARKCRPDPTILERKAREVQEHAITASHPQLKFNNHPYSYR